MMMKWTKLGRVFHLENGHGWMRSHAYLPTAIPLSSSRIRVYLAFRDEAQVGRIGWIDVDPEDPTVVLGVSIRPALDVGRPGAFDDNGVSPLAIVPADDGLRLYYAGWQLTPRARYLLLTGLAVSSDGGDTFTRLEETPVLERSSKELIIRSGAHVMKDGGVWKAWYAAGSDIIPSANSVVPTYHLAYAESLDGIRWPAAGRPSIIPNLPDEYGFGRPYVEKIGDLFHIWYSIRSHSKGYRIGYGVSHDGIEWERRDEEVGIDVSPSGWDSEMIGFASIIATERNRFMFYNGNGYGLTGVGVARLDES